MYKVSQFQANLFLFCTICNFCAIVFSQSPSTEPTTNITASEVKKEESEEIIRDVWRPDCHPPGCHHPHHHGHGWGEYPRTGSEVFMHYMNILNSCVNYHGLTWEMQQAFHKCKFDVRAEKNFDCFVLCLYVEIGVLSPVIINSATYYTENFQYYLNTVNQVITVDRCAQGDTVTSLVNCKFLLNRRHGWYEFVSYPPPPPFLYPDLDNCDALHGVFRCSHLNFFNLHHCTHNREDQDWLAAVKRNLTEAEEIELYSKENSTLTLSLV